MSAAGPAARRRSAVDPRPQLLEPEWLGDVVVGAELQGRDLVRLVVARRQDEDRGRAVAPDTADDGRPIGIGQAEVEDDEVGSLGIPGSDGVGRRARLTDLVAVRLEVRGDQRPRRAVVLDEQDVRAARGLRPRSAARSRSRRALVLRVRTPIALSSLGGSGAASRKTSTARPPSWLALARHLAAHGLGEPLHDAEPDAEPSPRAFTLPRHAIELVEQPRAAMRPGRLARRPRPGSGPGRPGTRSR